MQGALILPIGLCTVGTVGTNVTSEYSPYVRHLLRSQMRRSRVMHSALIDNENHVQRCFLLSKHILKFMKDGNKIKSCYYINFSVFITFGHS